MTEAQQEHANAVKHEAATLGALYTELCPDIISNGRFWQIYFVLLHSRLSKQDADLLSTPQVLQETVCRSRCGKWESPVY